MTHITINGRDYRIRYYTAGQSFAHGASIRIGSRVIDAEAPVGMSHVAAKRVLDQARRLYHGAL